MVGLHDIEEREWGRQDGEFRLRMECYEVAGWGIMRTGAR
jgi:hypothetical protein